MTESQLLSALAARANSRGVVLASEQILLRDLGIGSTALRQLLDKADASGAIEVVSPLPFLVAKLRGSWSGRKRETPRMAGKTAAPEDRTYSFQSSLSRSKQLMKESYRQPANEEALLREILETLGETDPATFRGALRSYAPDAIRLALERVRRSPAIRKNRTALFRYLLPRIAKESPSTK
jgi:hypothetical protein